MIEKLRLRFYIPQFFLFRWTEQYSDLKIIGWGYTNAYRHSIACPQLSPWHMIPNNKFIHERNTHYLCIESHRLPDWKYSIGVQIRAGPDRKMAYTAENCGVSKNENHLLNTRLSHSFLISVHSESTDTGVPQRIPELPNKCACRWIGRPLRSMYHERITRFLSNLNQLDIRDSRFVCITPLFISLTKKKITVWFAWIY